MKQNFNLSFRHVFAIALLEVCLFANACADRSDIELTDVLTMSARNMETLSKKIQDGEPIQVGFIGGSITQGAGSTSHSKCYYWLTKKNLKDFVEASNASLESTLAAVSGTGSDYGSYRLGLQLLDKDKLDMLVVEFAVNDYQNPRALDGMEGIVRQTLTRYPDAVIVLFYTVNRRMLDEYYDKVMLPPSVVAFHQIAQHYGLMEVHMGPLVQSMLVNGEESVDSFFKDHSHPLDAGHAFYAETLSKALIDALENAKPSSCAADLPSPLGTGAYERASLEPIVPIETSGEWTQKERGYYAYFGTWDSSEAGSSMSFDVKGEKIALLCNKVTNLHVIGPGIDERISFRGRRSGIPAMITIYDGDAPIFGRVTVTVEPNANGDVEASIAGLAIIASKPSTN